MLRTFALLGLLLVSNTHPEEITIEDLRNFLPHLSAQEHEKNVQKKSSTDFYRNALDTIYDHYQLPEGSILSPFIHSPFNTHKTVNEEINEYKAELSFQYYYPSIAEWTLENGTKIIFLSESHADAQGALWLQNKIKNISITTFLYEDAPLIWEVEFNYHSSNKTSWNIAKQLKQVIPLLRQYEHHRDGLCAADETETLFRIFTEHQDLKKMDKDINETMKSSSASADPTDTIALEICKKLEIHGYDILAFRTHILDHGRFVTLKNSDALSNYSLPKCYKNTLYLSNLNLVIHALRDGFMLKTLREIIKNQSTPQPETIVIQRGSYHLGNSWNGLEHILGKGTITFCPLFHVTSASEKLRKKEISASSPKVCGCIIQIVKRIENTSEQEMTKLIELFDTHILSGLTPASLNEFKEALDNETHKELKKLLQELENYLLNPNGTLNNEINIKKYSNYYIFTK